MRRAIQITRDGLNPKVVSVDIPQDVNDKGDEAIKNFLIRSREFHDEREHAFHYHKKDLYNNKINEKIEIL